MLKKRYTIHDIITPDGLTTFDVDKELAIRIFRDVQSGLKFDSILNVKFSIFQGMNPEERMLYDSDDLHTMPFKIHVLKKLDDAQGVYASTIEMCMHIPKSLVFYPDKIREDTKQYHYSVDINTCVVLWLISELTSQVKEMSLRIADERNNNKIFSYP